MQLSWIVVSIILNTIFKIIFKQNLYMDVKKWIFHSSSYSHQYMTFESLDFGYLSFFTEFELVSKPHNLP